jgi:hypothetical protein
MSNTEAKDYQECRGYLKFGVSVLAEGDKQADLTVKEEKAGGKDSDLLLPPHIKTKSCQLEVQVVKAEGIPKMDLLGSTDAFVEVEFAGNKLRTLEVECDKHFNSANWHEAIFMPVGLPCMTSTLIVRLYDKDAAKNEIIGTRRVKWSSV